MTEEVLEIPPTLSPTRLRRLLGDGRVGHRNSEICGAQQCPKNRDEHDPCNRATDVPLGTVPEQDCGDTERDHEDSEIRPDERGDAEKQERGPRQWRALLGCTTGLAGEEAPAPTDPQHPQTVLEAGGGEIPRRGQRDVEQEAEREHDPPLEWTGIAVRALSPVECPKRPVHREPQAEEGCPQSEHHGNPLEAERRYPVGHGEDEDPERTRACFDPVAEIEDQTVPVLELTNDAQVDECVVGKPPVGPSDRSKDDERDAASNVFP